MLSARQVGDEIELTVADDGIGIQQVGAAKAPEKRGGDYVAIFVRQLGGSIVPPGSRLRHDRHDTLSAARGAADRR